MDIEMMDGHTEIKKDTYMMFLLVERADQYAKAITDSIVNGRYQPSLHKTVREWTARVIADDAIGYAKCNAKDDDEMEVAAGYLKWVSAVDLSRWTSEARTAMERFEAERETDRAW